MIFCTTSAASEWSAQMQRMAMQMDPSKLAAMGLDPSMAKQAQQQFANLSPDDMARAREQACLERQVDQMRRPRASLFTPVFWYPLF